MAPVVVIRLPHSEQNGTHGPRFGVRTWRIGGRGTYSLAIVGLALMLIHHAAQAQRVQPWEDAQRLLYECSAAAGSFEEIDCGSYVEGVKDILAYLREHRFEGIPLPCLPTTMTVGQLEAVVSAFIRRNPQLYNAGGAPAVYAALVEAFPCR
jgi:hypothetical protein